MQRTGLGLSVAILGSGAGAVAGMQPKDNTIGWLKMASSGDKVYELIGRELQNNSLDGRQELARLSFSFGLFPTEAAACRHGDSLVAKNVVDDYVVDSRLIH